MIGIITGSGTYDLACMTVSRRPSVDLAIGQIAGCDVALLTRHGHGHRYLPHQIPYRDHIVALREAGVQGLILTSVVGSLSGSPEALNRLVVFDDLYFPDNRLPDGSACTLFTEPGAPGRGHSIWGQPFSETLRAAALTAWPQAEAGGTYAYQLGHRFNSRSEIRALQSLGVRAVSQTGGPEVVLANELEIPVVLLGYTIDHANGVDVGRRPERQPGSQHPGL